MWGSKSPRPYAAGGASVLAHAQAVPAAALAPDIEDPAVDTPEWADIYARSVERHRDERERIDREQAEAQQLWEQFLEAQGAELPEGERSLTTNDELHRQLLHLARTSGGEYERENVIGDPNQTFGVEIEFDGADANAVARAFHAAGLASTPNLQGYHSYREPGKWVVEHDSTVNGEVVSPVLRDTPETWAQLEGPARSCVRTAQQSPRELVATSTWALTRRGWTTTLAGSAAWPTRAHGPRTSCTVWRQQPDGVDDATGERAMATAGAAPWAQVSSRRHRA